MSTGHTEVFLFIDALGWEIVEKHDFLRRELPFRTPARMQFGYSCSAVPTILSGKRPDEHGHLCFYYYDPRHSPFKPLGLIPFARGRRALFNRGRVRHLLSRIFGKLRGFTGYFQLYEMPFDRIGCFNYCEKQDIFAASGLAPVENLHDLLEKSGLPYHISNWHLPDESNLQAAECLLAAGETRFYFIYTAELDGMLHRSVGKDDVIGSRLEYYARHIREMLRLLESGGGSYSLTVMSDHGMTPFRGGADIRGAVDALGLKFGIDYAACYDSTMFRVWYLRPESRDAIRSAVSSERFPGHYLSAADKKRYGIDFADNKYGDDIFLLDPGCQIVPSDLGSAPLNGMHGFLPEDRDSTAALLSTGPLPPVSEVADYFGIMASRISRMTAGD